MLMHQFEELISEYRHYNLIEKGIEERTHETYVRNTKKFIEYLDIFYINPPQKIEYINDSHVLDYLKFKKDKYNNTFLTIARCFKDIKYYFNFLYLKRYIKAPILDEISEFSVGYRIKRVDFFTKEELTNLVINLKTKHQEEPDNFLKHRNYIIMVLLTYSAMALYELINIKDEDINIRSSNVTIRGKRARVIYLNSCILELIKKYMNCKNSYMVTEYLFPSRYEKNISSRGIQKLIVDFSNEAGIIAAERSISPQTIRNTSIRMMIDDLQDLSAVASITGLELMTLVDYIEEDTPESDIKAEQYLNNHPINSIL